jgi:hypothetical protein
MKTRFVADGERRLKCSSEFQEQLRALRSSIHAKYAEEFAKAGFWRRLLLHWRVSAEFRRERRKLTPSPEAL